MELITLRTTVTPRLTRLFQKILIIKELALCETCRGFRRRRTARAPRRLYDDRLVLHRAEGLAETYDTRYDRCRRPEVEQDDVVIRMVDDAIQ